MRCTFMNHSTSTDLPAASAEAGQARNLAPHTAPASTSISAKPVSSEALLRGHKTVGIAHNGMLYTLQATKMGKLILTK